MQHPELRRLPPKAKSQRAKPPALKKSAGPVTAQRRNVVSAQMGAEGYAQSHLACGESQEFNVMEVVYPEDAELLATDPEVPRFTKLKVALDSGAGAHVINRRDAPGYTIQPSAMSKAGAAFLAADGGRIPNHGEVTVNMISTDSSGTAHKISSRFEAADVTRALWSVGLICDSGLDVKFTSKRALVCNKEGQELCVFTRSNGLYVAEVQVENPNHKDFHRQGS